jgi:hypothetical protein
MCCIASQHSLVQLGILYIHNAQVLDAESKLKIERNDTKHTSFNYLVFHLLLIYVLLCCIFNEDVVMGTNGSWLETSNQL